MSDETRLPEIAAKPAVPLLPCGHKASWEHEFVQGMLDITGACLATRQDPLELCMEYVREVFAYFYLQIPTYEEMNKIILSHKMGGSTEAH